MTNEFADALDFAEQTHFLDGSTMQARRAFLNALTLAPESLKNEVFTKAVQAGMLPPVPDGFDPKDDAPCYLLDSLAQHIGLTEDDSQFEQIHHCFNRIKPDGIRSVQ